MDYLVFDLFAVALPALLLLRGRAGRRALIVPVLGLSALALVWTGPWDDHLVSTHIWVYDASAVLARIGAVPAEEYAFVVLQVLLVGAWGLRAGTLRPGGRVGDRPAARWSGALGWVGVAVVGLLLVRIGGHVRYLGLLLSWAGPPLALQHLVAGDVLAARRSQRWLTALPVTLWLGAADRVALAHGTWTIGPATSTGLQLMGLPVEELLFFALTCLLVTDGLLLALDPFVVARSTALVRGRHLPGRRPVPVVAAP